MMASPLELQVYANMRASCQLRKLRANQFRKIPVEIVEAIFRFLRRSDQICFALSCKRIYSVYMHKENLNFAPRRESKIHEIDLRLRLQNKRRVYCTQCSIPHWLYLWRTIQSLLRLNHETLRCHSTYSIWHRPPFAAQVDICPCFTMPFYKHQLFTYLCRNPDVAYQALDGNFRNGPDIGCDEKFIEFTHLCAFSDHPSVDTQIKTNIWFDEASKSLQVINRFRFDIAKAGSSHLGPFGRTSSNKCIHKDTKRWLEDFFRRSKSTLQINTRDHSSCLWLGWDTSHTFEILLHRNLGDSKWPDKRWKGHCHE